MMGYRWIGTTTLVAFALVVPAQAAGFTTTQLDATAPANRMIGKLFVTKASGTTRCTASVVDAPNKSTILTAGHCFNNAGSGAASSASFAPGYHDGTAPFGEFAVTTMAPPPQWDTINLRFDFAFGVVARNAAGQPIQDVVGALPIAFNQPRNQTYHLYGIPAEPTPKYDREHLWVCDTEWIRDANDLWPGPQRIQAGCDFGVGSSGGPWVSGLGAVASVNSNSPLSDPNVENGPYLGNEASATFDSVKNISTAPPIAKKRCKKKGRHHKRALLAKKKCKKKHRHR